MSCAAITQVGNNEWPKLNFSSVRPGDENCNVQNKKQNLSEFFLRLPK